MLHIGDKVTIRGWATVSLLSFTSVTTIVPLSTAVSTGSIWYRLICSKKRK